MVFFGAQVPHSSTGVRGTVRSWVQFPEWSSSYSYRKGVSQRSDESRGFFFMWFGFLPQALFTGWVLGLGFT